MIIRSLVTVLVLSSPLQADDIRARMQRFVDSGEIAGAVTVVGRADGVISHEAVGFQNPESRAPMAKDALFRIASMTKPVTAIGILMLAEEGKLNLDDPVEKHLPEYRGQMLIESRNAQAMTLRKPRRPITIRDCLTHTSGMARELPPPIADLYSKRDRTLAESVLVFSQRPLESEPGSKWNYCNAGIDTLGRIIEVASGMPYAAFLETRVFQPLGMSDTTFFPRPDQLERVAVTCESKNGKLVPNPFALLGSPVGAKDPVPAAGLYSTGGDLAKLYRMLLHGGTLDSARILKPESVAEMTRAQTGNLEVGFVPGMAFGLGVGVVQKPQGVTERLSPGSYGHGGAFGTQGWIDPAKNMFVILLIQRWGLPNADGSPMRKELQAFAADLIGR